MAEWATQKHEFYKIAIAQGISHPSQIAKAFPLGHSIPGCKIDKWLTRLLESPKTFSSQRRYVNRFMIGADPEFIFNQVLKDGALSYEARIDARHLGFQQGLAFGADNNGRLTEIRPYPSRSAIEVVASIWSTFRWMGVVKPECLGYKWCCGAYLQDDGLGGHVHFGRKRPHRESEVAALDALAFAVDKLGLFPMAEVNERRISHTHNNQPYGTFGDIRIQRHGYEYRTWASWLDSPALAFLILTLSKLGVHDPAILLSSTRAREVNWGQYIKNFLAYYKFIDDDARLACFMLSRGWPRHQGGDFKGRWGLGLLSQTSDIKVIPPAIEPSTEEVLAMFTHLSTGKALSTPTGPPTWSPTKPPLNYEMCLPRINTVGIKGLGELAWDLCHEKSLPVNLICRNRDQFTPIVVSLNLAKHIPSKYFKGGYIHRGNFNGNIISLAEAHREHPDKAAVLRKTLLSGIFPIWAVSKVTGDSFAQWKASCPSKESSKSMFKGSVLFTTGRIPGQGVQEDASNE